MNTVGTGVGNTGIPLSSIIRIEWMDANSIVVAYEHGDTIQFQLIEADREMLVGLTKSIVSIIPGLEVLPSIE